MQAFVMATRPARGVRGERWVLGVQALSEKEREPTWPRRQVGAGGPAGVARAGGGRDSGPVARRAALGSEQVRALLGAVFFVLSVLYVVKTIAAATRATRQR
jgi:hypothetical protein